MRCSRALHPPPLLQIAVASVRPSPPSPLSSHRLWAIAAVVVPLSPLLSRRRCCSVVALPLSRHCRAIVALPLLRRRRRRCCAIVAAVVMPSSPPLLRRCRRRCHTVVALLSSHRSCRRAVVTPPSRALSSLPRPQVAATAVGPSCRRQTIATVIAVVARPLPPSGRRHCRCRHCATIATVGPSPLSSRRHRAIAIAAVAIVVTPPLSGSRRCCRATAAAVASSLRRCRVPHPSPPPKVDAAAVRPLRRCRRSSASFFGLSYS